MRMKTLSVHDKLARRREERRRQGGTLHVMVVLREGGKPALMYTTPCCGNKHYVFEGVPRLCMTCGRDHTNTVVMTERNLDHVVGQAVSRRHVS